MSTVISDAIDTIRRDFPILQERINGKPLVYFDNGASTQKPTCVINAVANYYQHDNANIHRSVHTLGERATKAYEHARVTVQNFIQAKHSHEIIFTKGTTEAINAIANCFARSQLRQGDEIIISALEHHANIVPWQLACEQTGATLKVIPMNQQGELIVDALPKLMTAKTKLIALSHIANAIGTINPIKQIIDLAHARDIPVLIDGAQAVSHTLVDVQALDCDFYVFSGHKLYGPTGIGVLYGKEIWLKQLPPYQGGGDMIKTVSFEKSTYADLPYKFEAGTPNIAGAIGLAAAIDYVSALGLADIAAYEHELLQYAEQHLATIPGLRFIGQAQQKSAIISFVFDDIHPHDIATILNDDGIAVRAGHHCAMPVMQFFNEPATVRASFSVYNTLAEIDRLVQGLFRVREVMGV